MPDFLFWEKECVSQIRGFRRKTSSDCNQVVTTLRDIRFKIGSNYTSGQTRMGVHGMLLHFTRLKYHHETVTSFFTLTQIQGQMVN